MKLITIMLAIIVLIPIALATDICEDVLTPRQQCEMLTPTLSCTTYNYTIYNQTNYITNGNLTLLENSIYYFNFNQSAGSYIVELCDGSTREIVVDGRDQMSSIAITLFVLFVSFGLFILPFVKQFSKFEITNLILKRACWTIAIYLMVLNSAIMATIAEFAGIDLTAEMFRYMWLFGTAGYVLMGFMVLKTLFDVIKLYKIKKTKERTGESDDD